MVFFTSSLAHVDRQTIQLGAGKPLAGGQRQQLKTKDGNDPPVSFTLFNLSHVCLPFVAGR